MGFIPYDSLSALWTNAPDGVSYWTVNFSVRMFFLQLRKLLFTTKLLLLLWLALARLP